MKVSEVKVSKLSEGKVKALASITLDGAFVVTGVKVVDGAKGLFVTMPQTKKEDKYFDVVFPLGKELRAEIQDKVLEAYNK